MVSYGSDNCLHDQDQCLPIADTQGIWLSHCLRDCKVSLTRTFIGPTEYIPQQINLIEFIHAQSAIYVRLPGHVDKGEGAQVVPNQWDVGSKTRDTLVDILKGLQIRQLHHHEKGLLEGTRTCRSRKPLQSLSITISIVDFNSYY